MTNIKNIIKEQSDERERENKQKESVRLKLVDTAKKLAVSAKQKEIARLKLAITAKKLEVTATKLALVAKEKEEIRRKLERGAEETTKIISELWLLTNRLLASRGFLSTKKTTPSKILKSKKS